MFSSRLIQSMLLDQWLYKHPTMFVFPESVFTNP